MFRKKLYYSVLISAVFLTFEPVFAAEIHVSTWDELKSAVENGIDGAGAGGTVYLDKNIDVPDDFNSTITTAVPGIVIDGQGNTITVTGSGREAFDFSSSVQTDLQIKNVVFESSSANNHAITNEGTLGNINADFINNKQVFSYNTSGGAIDNNNGTIGDITGDFTNNHVQALMGGRADGGAIDNSYGTIGDITGDFTGNYAQSDRTNTTGGAISNISGTIGDITGDFSGNHAQSDSGMAQGGAIYNNFVTIGDITGDFSGNYAQSDVNSAYGGAIYMYYGTIGNITGDFSSNYAQASRLALGGAIYNVNAGIIANITGDFSNNYAQSDGGAAGGGAIYNSGIIGDITGDFSGNYAQAQSNSSEAAGGAIYNTGSIFLTNSSFYDNYAQSNSSETGGGAIYNAGNMTITADNGVSEFSGNKIIHNDDDGNKVEDNEAIYNVGNLTLNAVNNGVIRFDDKINGFYVDIEEGLSDGGRYDVISDNAGGYYVYDGENLQAHLALTESGYMLTDYSSIIPEDEVAAELELMENLGAQITQQGDDYHIVMYGQEIDFIKTENGYVKQGLFPLTGITITGDDSGRVEFNNEVKEQALYLGGDVTAVMKSGSDFSTSSLNTLGGKISLIDEAINRFAPKELNLMSGVARLGLDIDLANKTGDFITADTINLRGGSLLIDELNILSDETSPNTKVAVVDTKGGLSEQTSLKEGIEAYGPIYKYDTSYDKTTGEIEFINAGKAEGGASGGDVSYGDLNPDVTAVPVSTNAGVYISQANVYREALGNAAMLPVSPAGMASGDVMAGRAWMRPFMSDEEVSLDNGPKVDNRVWGMLVGLDSRKVYFDNCWDGVFSGYVGTTGSRQKYDGVRINQKAAVLGASAMFKRGEFWTGLTANVMYGDGKAHTRFGTDDFHNLSTGFALKAGRNFYLGDGFTLQPSFMGSYTYVKTSDYTTSAGVDIDSDAIQIVQLTPGLRLMWDAGNGWMPYIGYSYYWNLVDDSKVKANNVVLPEISVKPYSEYALGVIKEWDVVDSYFQLVYRNGGREGIDLQAGVSYEF